MGLCHELKILRSENISRSKSACEPDLDRELRRVAAAVRVDGTGAPSNVARFQDTTDQSEGHYAAP
jgi:hypothetical protein